MNWNLKIESVHGYKAPLPFVKSVEVNLLSNTPIMLLKSYSSCFDNWLLWTVELFKMWKFPHPPVDHYCLAFAQIIVAKDKKISPTNI